MLFLTETFAACWTGTPYQEVVAFAGHVEAFALTYPDLLFQATDALQKIDAGVDYFGFVADEIWPSSPSRYYAPNDLTTAYMDSVVYFDQCVRQLCDHIDDLQQHGAVMQTFRQQHRTTANKVRDSFDTTSVEIAASAAKMHAIADEVFAVHWNVKRLSGVLRTWAEHVDWKLKKLAKEHDEQQKPEWLQILEAVWAGIKLVVSIVLMIKGAVDAVRGVVAAIDKLKEIAATGEKIYALYDLYDDSASTWSPNAVHAWKKLLKGTEATLLKQNFAFLEAMAKPIGAIVALEKKYKAIRSAIAEFGATAANAGDPDAERFYQDVLTAGEIGVHGAMTYLQVDAEIAYHNDMLRALYKKLESESLRHRALLLQYAAYGGELVNLTEQNQFLEHVLSMNLDDIELARATARRLQASGQGPLDALMHLLRIQSSQMRYLELDNGPTTERYDLFVGNAGNIGQVLQRRNEVLDDIASWQQRCWNKARVSLHIVGEPQSTPGITVEDSAAIARFKEGTPVRPSLLLDVEPLALHPHIAAIGEHIAAQSDDSVSLAAVLNAHLLVTGENATTLADAASMGLDSPVDLVERARMWAPTLASFDDTTVIMAHCFQTGALSMGHLTTLTESDELSPELKSRVHQLMAVWNAFTAGYVAARQHSLRGLVVKLRDVPNEPTAARDILIPAFMRDGQFAGLACFGFIHDDLVEEVRRTTHMDGEAPLADILEQDQGMSLLLAVGLLHANFETDAVLALADAFDADHPIRRCLVRDCIDRWDPLRRSALERRHELAFAISEQDVRRWGAAANTWRRARALCAWCEVDPAVQLPVDNVWVERTGPDTFLTDDGPITMDLPDSGQSVPLAMRPEPPTLEACHYENLFGRSLIGRWRVELRTVPASSDGLSSIARWTVALWACVELQP